MRFRASASLLVVVLLLSVSSAQRGALVRPASLPEMARQAHRIVHGYVTAAKVEPHPRYRNISTVVVTIAVTETLKGRAPKQFTFREFIWDLHDQIDAAGFRKGKEVVLFLNKENEEGLTGTIGADQGRFDVLREKDGRSMVRAHAANLRMLEGTQEALSKRNRPFPASLRAAQANPDAAIDLKEFKSVVRDLADVRGDR